MQQDFVRKPKPSGREYLESSYEDLINRINYNLEESEIYTAQAVITIRAAQSQIDTNLEMVKANKQLVETNKWLVLINVVTAAISFLGLIFALLSHKT